MPSAEDTAEAWRRLGRSLAGFRTSAGHHQIDLAVLLSYHRSTIANVETGRQHVPRNFWVQCDDLLNAGGSLTREYDRIEAVIRETRRRASVPAASVAIIGSDASTQAEDTETVLRRTVFQALTVLGAATFLPAADRLEATWGSAADWRETVHEYGYTYLSTPRRQFLSEAAPDLGDLLSHLERARDDYDARLLAASGARLAALMALACTDLGYAREARHIWRLARGLSSRAGDADTDMWVRGQEVVIGLYQRRPIPILTGIARHPADTGDERTSAGAVQLLAARAQLHATLGQHQHAHDALNQATDLFDRLPETVTGNTDSAFGWPEQRLRHAESFVTAHAGHRPGQPDVHDQALALYDPARHISRAQVELHRALAMVRSRDPRSGIEHASRTLDGVGAEHRRLFVLAVAGDVLAAVPADERKQSYVTAYHDQLTAAGASPHA